jgi:hypothetical protein
MHAESPRPASAQHATPAIPTQIAVVHSKPADLWLEALGTVQAWNTAIITPQVSGQMIDLPFQEGRLVHAGNVFVRGPFEDRDVVSGKGFNEAEGCIIFGIVIIRESLGEYRNASMHQLSHVLERRE